MNELTIINTNGQFTIDSREVAEMTEVRHSDLLDKVHTYEDYLLNGEFRSVDFFIRYEYQDSTGRKLPCYLLTRKGCDMVANKMTGEKGVLFTAAYVTKFEEMEKGIETSKLSPQLQLFSQMFQAIANNELRLKQAENIALEAKSGLEQAREVINGIKDTMAELPKDQWRKWVNSSMALIVKKRLELGHDLGKDPYEFVKGESYKLLNEQGFDVYLRVKNQKARLLLEGATKARTEEVKPLSVIEADSKMRKIYDGIVKELRIKFLV